MKDILGLLVLSWPLVLLVLIVLVILVAVPLAVRHAKKRGYNMWAWGIGAFLLIFLPIFWDWVPTVLVHKYYCSTEAGFWVYKTVDQWKAENPGVFETLKYNKKMPPVETPYGPAAAINQRIIYLFRYDGPLLFNRWRKQMELRDSVTGEIIARAIDFSTSQKRRQAGSTGWKFWLDSESCSNVAHRDQGSFDKMILQFEGAKE